MCRVSRRGEALANFSLLKKNHDNFFMIFSSASAAIYFAMAIGYIYAIYIYSFPVADLLDLLLAIANAIATLLCCHSVRLLVLT